MIRHALATLAIVSLIATFIFVAGCDKESGSPTNGKSSAKNPAPAAGTHVHDDGTVHTDAPHAASHGGAIIELGSATIGPFTVRASRDQGEIKPGGDAPIDVWLTGSDAKVLAVRFWIGTPSGDESVKAKADIENPAEPNHWHTHAEVPNPTPAGSKLWVEIEVDGQKQVGSFDLKQ